MTARPGLLQGGVAQMLGVDVCGVRNRLAASTDPPAEALSTVEGAKAGDSASVPADRTPAPGPYGSFPSGFLCDRAGSSRQDRLSLFSLSAFSGLRDGPACAGASEVGDARPHQDFMAILPRSVFLNRAWSPFF